MIKRHVGCLFQNFLEVNIFNSHVDEPDATQALINSLFISTKATGAVFDSEYIPDKSEKLGVRNGA